MPAAIDRSIAGRPDGVLLSPGMARAAADRFASREAPALLIRTDFILSAEIIVIALGTVPENASFAVTALVVSAIGLVMTVGVYGLVAGIVKLDDAGFWLMDKEGAASKRLGSILVGASPKLMRFLGVAGTLAMFTVGGGILAHGLPFFHVVSDTLATLPAAVILEAGVTALFGVAAGAILVAAVFCVRKVRASASQ